MKTQVGIIGGGPSGLLLSQILHLAGIDNVVLERQSRDYVLRRIRAGVLEQGTCNMLRQAQVGDRMDREGQIHTGFALAFDDDLTRIDLESLAGGKTVMVYGQTEVTRDLYHARDAMDGAIIHDAADVTPHDVNSDAPYLTWSQGGDMHRLDCDFIAACDGAHGVGRKSIPKDVLKEYEQVYPFGWLGVLSRTTPAYEELIYAGGSNGFALCSMRNESLSRYYVQAPLDTDVAAFSDERFWEELKARIPADIARGMETGPSIEKSIAPLRSYVAEPLQYGRLFLAGDAGHIVPPTGAKGLNLAVSDIRYLSDGLIAYYRGDEAPLRAYSETALRRVWKTERFSWYMTMLLHSFPGESDFRSKMRAAEVDYVASSRAAQTSIAENYVGLPY